MKNKTWILKNILVAVVLFGCHKLEPAPPSYVTDPVKEAQELLDYHHATFVKEIRVDLLYNGDATKSEKDEFFKTAEAMDCEVEIQSRIEGEPFTAILIHRREKLEKKDLEKIIAGAIALAKRTRASCHLVYKEPRESP
jgi:hypothetical protein